MTDNNTLDTLTAALDMLAPASVSTPVPAPELVERPTESLVEVVELGDILPHPNPESTLLETTTIHSDYPVICRRGEFKKGQRAVYVPVDSMVPTGPRADGSPSPFAFLKTDKPRTHERIKAKRLKGFFSMGLLIPLPAEHADAPAGTNLTAALGVEKYEPPEVGTGGPNNGNQVHVPQQIPIYGIEGYRKYGRLLEDYNGRWEYGPEQRDEHGCVFRVPEWFIDPSIPAPEVVVTTKYDGQNWRAAYLSKSDTVIVGSHRTFRDPAFVGSTAYHTHVFQRYGLAEKLRLFPDIAIYGEVYGAPTGGSKALTYGATKNAPVGESTKLRLFDALNLKTNQWLDYDDFVATAQGLGIPTVEVLYRGPFDAALIRRLVEGQSSEGNHIREGIVIGTTKEGRFANGVRKKLKFISESYLLLKS